MNQPTTDNIVVANTYHEQNPYQLLEQTLAEAGFLQSVENARQASGKIKTEFFIVIKPNISMMLRRADIGTYTDSFLVIHLLRLLLAAGYTRLAVVESGNLYGNWFENRSVIQVAARAGYFEESVINQYRGETSRDIHVRGNGVDAGVPLTDLELDTISHDFGDGSAPIGRVWADADFRIGISGLKSHFYSYYTAAIKNIYGCLPEQDKVTAYHCKRRVGPWTARLIADFPVHYSIVTAYSAADGWMGVKMKAVFVKPHTVVAGADIQAVDSVCARLINLPPEKSVMYRCLAEINPPRPYQLKGNATTFNPWRNVPALLPLFSWLIEANANIMDFGGSIATGGNDPCFPVKASFRGFFKTPLYYASFPVSFFCDIGIVRLKFRRWRFYRALRRRGVKIPFILKHTYIIERLELFSHDDLGVLTDLARRNPREKISCSGHFLSIDDEQIAFPSRFFVAVLAGVEILNYVRENCGRDEFRNLADELSILMDHPSRLFDPNQPYPFCYR